MRFPFSQYPTVSTLPFASQILCFWRVAFAAHARDKANTCAAQGWTRPLVTLRNNLDTWYGEADYVLRSPRSTSCPFILLLQSRVLNQGASINVEHHHVMVYVCWRNLTFSPRPPSEIIEWYKFLPHGRHAAVMTCCCVRQALPTNH